MNSHSNPLPLAFPNSAEAPQGPFDMAAPGSQEIKLRPWLMTQALAGSAALSGVLIACGAEPPIWLQPTLIGFLWGGLFVAGFVVGGVGGGRFLASLAALGCGGLFGLSIGKLTLLPTADCLLIAATLLSSGWLVGRCGRLGRYRNAAPRETATQPQWSIADLGFATCMVACFCQALPNLDTAPSVLFTALIALAAGLVCSWLAYRWAWQDEWTPLGVLSLVGSLIAICGLTYFGGPPSRSLAEALRWMLTGPINVVACQATTVLLALALMRFDAHRHVAADHFPP